MWLNLNKHYYSKHYIYEQDYIIEMRVDQLEFVEADTELGATRQS